MRNYSSESFGLLIAFLIPGSILLWGLGQFHPDILSWLGATEKDTNSIGGFLYGTVASIACGLIASTLRWLVIDWIHHRTGIETPKWNLHVLHERTNAYINYVDNHYRYYQFYSNSIISLLLAMPMHWFKADFNWWEFSSAFFIIILFFFASRDALSKYYGRIEAVLSDGTEK